MSHPPKTKSCYFIMSVLQEIGAHVLLFFLVFGMSATVDIGQMKKQLRNRNALLTGISLQFLILPFVGFVIVKVLNMDAPLGITLLVVTSSPGGSYSNCTYTHRKITFGTDERKKSDRQTLLILCYSCLPSSLACLLSSFFSLYYLSLCQGGVPCLMLTWH